MSQILHPAIVAAAAEGKLLPSTVSNIEALLSASNNPLYLASVNELAESEAWTELNDRFYRTLAFGTGGLRGRSIGAIVTAAEKGTLTELGRPEFPCVGTNALNYFNISRATQGLMAYVFQWFRENSVKGRPRLAIAYDSRHFSKEFAALAAKVASELGCDVFLFSEPRSTPELSFAVRHTNSHAGIVITASHNPPHDNGYKVYFGDGAQVLAPHDKGIIDHVTAIAGETYEVMAPENRGVISHIGKEIDDAYCARLVTLLQQPELLKSAKGLKFVFTPIHGTGGALIPRVLEQLGFDFLVVPEQAEPDGRFPTVPSPNPENASALAMGIALAEKENADAVIATDPDADRMGVAVRDQSGKMQLLTGNQIGSLMAYYRTKTFIEQGILNAENVKNATIIKTFVTTDLQLAIAKHYGLKSVETLTGFKYIGRKLANYEAALPLEVRENYRSLTEEQTRDLRLAHSTFYVFGGEESYGYLAADFVRDKDANAAVILFAELSAYAKSKEMTLVELMDEVYSIFGFYHEKSASIYFEGAEGADKIKRLVASYGAKPLTEIAGIAVSAYKDFAEQDFVDSEGEPIAKEKMLIFELVDGSRVAVRASGTEPKIKYYLFANQVPNKGEVFTADQLAAAKVAIQAKLDAMWSFLEADSAERAKG